MEALETLNEQIQDQPVNLDIVNPDDVHLIDKNARYMEDSTFDNLVKNIERDGGLSSVPLCWRTPEGGYEVLSGNHRIKAAREAEGVDRVIIFYTDEDLSESERRAIQISHNEIVGQDDTSVLLEIYDEIDDVEMKEYSGIDEDELDRIELPSLDGLSDPRLDFRELTFLFLPEETEDLKQVFEEALEFVDAEEIHLTRIDQYDELLDSMREVKRSYNIFNSATALQLIIDVYRANREDLKEGWFENDEVPRKHEVPISSVLGTDEIPKEVAEELERVKQTMMARKEIEGDEKWKVLQQLTEEYE